MSYNFKKIMDLDLVTDVPEGANVLIETDGATKRLPSTAINNGYSKEEVYTKEESDAKYLAKSDFNIAPPDMAQNDQTQPDYVKNRTHWSETSIIIEERNLTGFAVGQDPLYGVENPFTFSPVVGEHYIVHWDGTAYSVDAFDAYGMVCLGNENYADMTTGGNIPFAIVTTPDGGVFVVTESTAASHTIAIEGEVIHKLDKKYLPDDVGGGYDLVLGFYEDLGNLYPSYLYNVEANGSIARVYDKIANGDMPKVLFKCMSSNSDYINTHVMQLMSAWAYGDTAILCFQTYNQEFVKFTINSAGDLNNVEISGDSSVPC